MQLYLSSYEYKSFAIPRSVTRYEKARLSNRNVLIVEVDRPLIGQKYGFQGKDITTFYLINRVDEDAFDTLNQFPIEVHVCVVKTPEIVNPTSIDDLQNIVWASLYDDEIDAKNHRIV